MSAREPFLIKAPCPAGVVTLIPRGAGVPSGMVDFMLEPELLSKQTLLPTSATTSAESLPDSASQLVPGANTLTAVYPGNSIAPCCNMSEPPRGGKLVAAYHGHAYSLAGSDPSHEVGR